MAMAVLSSGLLLALPRGRDWIYREVSYQVVLERAVGRETDPLRVTEQATRYVDSQLYPAGGPILDTDSWTLLIRGIGVCDQKAWAIGTLLALKGIHGRLVMLRNEQGVSTHTLLGVLLSERWCMVSTSGGSVFRKSDGSPATLEDLSGDSGLATSQPAFQLLASPGRESMFDLFQPLFPIRKPPVIWPSVLSQRKRNRLQAVAEEVIHRTWSRLGKGLAHRFQDLYLALLPKRWGSPEEHASTLYVQARNYHLYHRLDKAAARYRELIALYPTSSYTRKSLFWTGAVDLQQGRADEAIQTLSRFLAEYPHSSWKTRAYDLLAKAYESKGDLQKNIYFTRLALTDPYVPTAARLAVRSRSRH